MLRLTITRSLKARSRNYSTIQEIPFDTKPFPFDRFEPCCPDVTVEKAPNGYVPCQHHKIPHALGKKIEFQEPMTRPNSLRHIVGCIGHDADEWTRARCEWAPGIIQSLDKTKEKWTGSVQGDQEVIVTVAEKPSVLSDPKRPDVLIFPEFKRMSSVDISQEIISQQSPLYPVLSSIWQDPTRPLVDLPGLEDLESDVVVLVCTHARRDLRCGYLGPPIVDEFNSLAKKMGLDGKLEVWGTSHFGGHKYAGNIIIHQRGMGGHVYGNVRACHVKDIIDRHVIHGKVIKELWRGMVTPPSF